MKVLKRNGKTEDAKLDKLTHRVEKLSYGLNIDPIMVSQKASAGLFDGVTTKEIDRYMATIASNLAVHHPDYAILAGRIVTTNLHKYTNKSFYQAMKDVYNDGLDINKKGETVSRILGEGFLELIRFHGKDLDKYINDERDMDFDYFGINTLIDKYLHKSKTGLVLERPQHMYMRVALTLYERDLDAVVNYYERLSKGENSSATPTSMNAGHVRQQMSSCFLQQVEDDSIQGIYSTLSESAAISQSAGGVGISISNIRAKGSLIRSSNRPGTGILPMLKVFNDTALYVDQGGKRKGAFAVYLEPWHADVIDFLNMRREETDEKLRSKDLFAALWVNSLFMDRLQNDETWSLMCPDECPGLVEAYGDDFKSLYEKYEAEGKFKTQMKATDLWEKIINTITTHGHGRPYIAFKDHANNKSNQQNIGTIKSSNLCLSEDTMILTRGGHFPIKDLVGKEVEIYDGINWVKNRNFKKTGDKQKILSVVMRDGAIIKCTPTHKFPLENGIKIEAQNLKKGDKIRGHEVKNKEGKFEAGAYAKGFLIGDGSLVKDDSYSKPLLQLYYPKVGCSNRIINSIKEIKTNKTLRDAGVLSFHHDVNSERFILSGLASYKDGLNDYCGKYKRTFNNDIFNWDINSKVEFIAGLFDADGSIVLGNKITSYQISFNEKDFIYSLKDLLQSIGIKSSIKLSQPEGQRDFGEERGGVFLCKNVYRITISNQSARKLSSICTFSRLVNFEINASQTRCGREYNVKPTYNEVREVLDLNETSDVYCTLVPSTNNFALSNGLMTGNCIEIMEVADADNTAVCNLTSVALAKFLRKRDNGQTYFDHDELGAAVEDAVDALNRVIDRNYYPSEKTRESNNRARPVGLGVQGLADVFMILGFPYDSEEARELNRRIFETMYLHSLRKSCELAKRDGAYPAFEGSPASKGILQFDMWGVTPSRLEEFNSIKEEIKKHGLRNSLLMALMPTATTSQILGNTESFEPVTSNLYLRITDAGEFAVVNKHLVRALEAVGLWDRAMSSELIQANGSIQNIDRIPDDIKKVFRTVWEISQRSCQEMSADRGAYVCQSQSMNLYLDTPSVSKTSSALMNAYKLGLKTGMYYFRTKSATDAANISQSTADAQREQTLKDKMVCSLDNPENCDACGA